MARQIFLDDETPTPTPVVVGPASRQWKAGDASAPTRKPRTVRVLLIEGDLHDASRIQQALSELGSTSLQLEHVSSLTRAAQSLTERDADLILLDLAMLECWGINTLLRVKALAPDVPVVILTGLDDEGIAITALHEGAEDYLVKGHVTSHLLIRSVRYAIERGRRRRAESSLRRTREEFRIARKIQQKLFPAAAPVIDGFDIGGASFPADETGGDYFDYISMAHGRCAITVGDVAGHGFGSALLMAETRAYLHALAATCHDVVAVLDSLNKLLVKDVAEDYFVTLFLGCLDPLSRSFVYASAGHPDGFVLLPSGEIASRLESTGRPLGVQSDSSFDGAVPLELKPGSLCFLMTDGVFENRSGSDETFGLNRALDVVRANRHRPAQQIVHVLYSTILQFCKGHSPDDDVTAIVIKVE